MPCVSADGKLTVSGERLLTALNQPMTAIEIAQKTKEPLYRVRSGLREMVAAGFVSEAEDQYSITETGKEALKSS